MSLRDVPETVRDEVLSSCKLVFKILQEEGELTYSEIVDETTLPESTVRWRLDRLQKFDVVEQQFSVDDAPVRRYRIRKRVEKETIDSSEYYVPLLRCDS